VSARSLAPDLARGAMLLLIALANVPLYLYGNGTFGTGSWLRGHPCSTRRSCSCRRSWCAAAHSG